MEDRLIKFARIVDAGSFTKAAGELHISQPALTVAIKKLERELQAELLLRGTHPLRVSAAGAIAYETGRAIIAQTQNMAVRIGQAADQKVILKLGLIDSVANMLFVHGSYLQELEQAAQVSLSIDNSSRLLGLTDHGELDVALIAEPKRLPSNLETNVIGQEPLALVSHVQLASDIYRQLSRKKITRFLSYNQASRTFQVVNEFFVEHGGVRLEPTFYSTSPEIMLQLVLNKRGSAVLPYALVGPQVRAGELSIISVAGRPAIISRTIISIRRPGHILAAAAEDVLSKTRQKLQRLNHQVKLHDADAF